MSKLTCRGCGKELENCTCNVLTTKKEQTEKLKLIGKDEMLCVSLPFGWCFDEVKDLIEASCIFQLDADQLVVNKLEAERDAAISQVGKLARELGQQDARIEDLESINESHRKLNGELRERIKELEETAITKGQAMKLIRHIESDITLLHNDIEWAEQSAFRALQKTDFIERCNKDIGVNECLFAKLQKIIDKRG